jgi:hypothetical protein
MQMTKLHTKDNDVATQQRRARIFFLSMLGFFMFVVTTVLFLAFFHAP